MEGREQYAVEFEDVRFFVVLVLVLTAFGNLDEDVNFVLRAGFDIYCHTVVAHIPAFKCFGRFKCQCAWCRVGDVR